ncbi:MAG: hypothetical protein EPO68_01070, partial [Planctomycetota bacterium]
MTRLRAFASTLALATALAAALASACSAPLPPAPRLDLSAPPAALRLPAIFGPHMVLQRSARARIHGWAAAGSAISIQASWLADPVACRADERGTWAAELAANEPGGPHRITIQSGAQTLALDDVLIGDVWLCSGQSNMEMSIRDQAPGGFGVADEAAELAAASRPQLRLFDVENAVAPREQSDCRGEWRVCDAQSVASFSAVGYFFGAAVHAATGTPIGLVGSNWGGTRIEAWTSTSGLADFADERANLEFVRDEREHPERNVARSAARRAAWWSELDQIDPPAPRVAPGAALDGWGTLEVPAMWSGEYEGYDGTLWLRREFELPAGLVGSDLVLELGPIDDMDTVWLDGERVGGMQEAGRWTEPRRYEIPARLATAGAHVLAIRVLDTGGGVGVAGAPDASRLRARDGIGGPKVALAGAWRARRGVELAKLQRFPESGRFG